MQIWNSKRVRVGAGSALIVVVCLAAPGCADLQTSLANVASLINQITACAGINETVTVEEIETPVREFLASSGFAVDDGVIAFAIDTFLIPILEGLLQTCQTEGLEGLIREAETLLGTPGFEGLVPGLDQLPGGPSGPGGPPPGP